MEIRSPEQNRRRESRGAGARGCESAQLNAMAVTQPTPPAEGAGQRQQIQAMAPAARQATPEEHERAC